ncbi:hypothetical protein ACFQ0T_14455 [Kitasatospora gansuensis]
MRLSRLTPLAAATAALALFAPTAQAATAPQHDGSWTYRDPAPLGGGFDLGGFSDLFPADDSGEVFWTLTDRGPNADARPTPTRSSSSPTTPRRSSRSASAGAARSGCSSASRSRSRRASPTRSPAPAS